MRRKRSKIKLKHPALLVSPSVLEKICNIETLRFFVVGILMTTFAKASHQYDARGETELSLFPG
jgi:hypothetical protein